MSNIIFAGAKHNRSYSLVLCINFIVFLIILVVAETAALLKIRSIQAAGQIMSTDVS